MKTKTLLFSCLMLLIAFTTFAFVYDDDSDGDLLSDFFEMFLSKTDPFTVDTDANGIPDSDEDPDADGLTNLMEQAAEMDPHFPAVDGGGYLLEKKVQENAVDGDTAGWDLYDDVPIGTITNVIDPDDASNRAIKLTGGDTTGYRYTFANKEYSQFKVEWRMRFTENYTVFFGCQTTEGYKYIYYSDNDTDTLNLNLNDYEGKVAIMHFPPGKPERAHVIHVSPDAVEDHEEHGDYVILDANIIHLSLGGNTANGSWVKIRRDLQRDLWGVFPNAEIEYVDSFLVSGNGYIDDMATMAYPDADRDLIPDAIEIAIGLDPNDYTDANTDSDGDGISDLDEFLNGTLDIDSDGDGISNADELANGMNPNDPNDPGLLEIVITYPAANEVIQ